jgi:hypothetical protein
MEGGTGGGGIELCRLGRAVAVDGGDDAMPGNATPPKGGLTSFSIPFSSGSAIGAMGSGSSFRDNPCIPDAQPFVAGGASPLRWVASGSTGGISSSGAADR